VRVVLDETGNALIETLLGMPHLDTSIRISVSDREIVAKLLDTLSIWTASNLELLR
jgi:hypothetical protein